jgi:hypothetical protein
MKRYSDVYKKANIRRLKHTYYPYPPEFKALYGLQLGMSDTDIDAEIKKNANHYDKKYGKILIKYWGAHTPDLVKTIRSMISVEKQLTGIANKIDVYSLGTVFIQLDEYISGSGLSTMFKKMYKELVKRMVAMDPNERITPSELLEKLEILKKV